MSRKCVAMPRDNAPVGVEDLNLGPYRVKAYRQPNMMCLDLLATGTIYAQMRFF